MKGENKYTVDDAQRFFGIEFNNTVFKLAEKETLSTLEKEEIIQTAHASVLHWQKFPKSTIANSQRGYYMVAKAYVVVGEKENALKYAKLCYEITQENSNELFDWDLAYSYEMMARTAAMNNDKASFDLFYKKTKEQELRIKDKGDLKYFSADFAGGNWFNFI